MTNAIDLKDAATRIEKALACIEHDDPEGAARPIADAIRWLEQAQRDNVAAMRRRGTTWQWIADALGITRQSAHERYRELVR